MKAITNLFEKYKGRHSRKVLAEAEERSSSIYQLREYEGEIWLTFCGSLVCPTAMLNEDAVTAIKVMRKAYVERAVGKYSADYSLLP